MKHYKAIGVMSGSSLDGLDVCLVDFIRKDDQWDFEILKSATLNIPDELKDKLRASDSLSTNDLQMLDREYGEWIGYQVAEFSLGFSTEMELVAVHGHTVFHEPKRGLSLQLGNGQIIADTCGIPSSVNFRMADILKGGQGAPLVPFGEHYLFNGHQAFINCGGIANISIHQKEKILAWDICPFNQVLNHFAKQLGKQYDQNGDLARKGRFDDKLYEEWKSTDYFHRTAPKSLSNQWGHENIIAKAQSDPNDALNTYSRLAADLIYEVIDEHVLPGGSIMLTGGGVYNSLVIDMIKTKSKGKYELFIPGPRIIDFKEALIFAFLGLMRKLDKVNTFSSVTGASDDSSGGDIFVPGKGSWTEG